MTTPLSSPEFPDVPASKLAEGLRIIDALTKAQPTSNPAEESQNQQEDKEKKLNADLYEWCYLTNEDESLPPSSQSSSSSSSSQTPLTITTTNCFTCLKSNSTLKCASCKTAIYCSRACQLLDWKKSKNKKTSKNGNANENEIGDVSGSGYHKINCENYKKLCYVDCSSCENDVGVSTRLLNQQKQPDQTPNTHLILPEHNYKTTIENSIIRRIRMYLCPFAVAKYSCLLLSSTSSKVKGENVSKSNRGFVLLQTTESLLDLHFFAPVTDARSIGGQATTDDVVNSSGHANELKSRSLSLQYITQTELTTPSYDIPTSLNLPPALVSKLVDKIENYDPETHVVVVVAVQRYLKAVVVTRVVPDYRVCLALGGEYDGVEEICLNLDDL